MATMEYVTSARIAASPDAVWRLLTDAAGYASWNPEMVGVAGRFAAGERIKASVKVKAGGGKMAIRAVPLRITAFDPPSPQRQRGTMEWTGGLPFGLFTGRRLISVSPADGGTDFRMELKMSGPLAGAILKSLGDRQPEIDSFTAGLKTRAEQQPR
jgi:carbon monoxide dehydrogenase subunit G